MFAIVRKNFDLISVQLWRRETLRGPKRSTVSCLIDGAE